MAQRQVVRSFMTTVRTLAPNPSKPGGAGGGGGRSAGAIHEAGGAFGKAGDAREEEYFAKLKHAQFKELKAQLVREIEHHEGQVDNHQQAIERHQRRLAELSKEEKELKGL